MSLNALDQSLNNRFALWYQSKGTLGIILANIILFLFQTEPLTSTHLLSDGANFAPFSLSNEPYRLVSSFFLHGGFFHLAINMFYLFVLGKGVEQRLGTLQFVNLYFLCGVMGSLFSCHFNLFSIGVGASGAVFGLYGFVVIDEWRTKAKKFSIIIKFIIFIALNYLLSVWLNIDQYAHLGGFLTGIFIFLSSKYIDRFFLVFLYWLIPMGVVLGISNEQAKYYHAYQYMLQKDDHIRSALNSYYLDKDEQIEKINLIKTLPDSIKLRFAKIDKLPTELQLDTAAINTFFNYRNVQISYFLKLLENDSYLYQDSILYIRDLLSNSKRPMYTLNFDASSDDNNIVRIDKTGLKQQREYYDENWDVTPYAYKAKYYRIGTKDSLDNWHGKIVDYFADDTPQMRGTYHRDLMHGIFIYYNDDGTISSAGRYENDEKVGKWENYYSDNRLLSEIRYVGTYSFIESILDTLGNYMVTNGKGIDINYYDNGQIEFQREVVGGLNHGVFEGFYDDGKPHFIEYHKEGFLEYGISYDTLGNVYRYEEQTEWPYPDGGFENIIAYFEANNKMKSSTINDFVQLKFQVEKDGKIKDILVTKSLGPERDNHAKELLLNGPKWNPARFRGFEIVERTSYVHVAF